MKRLATYLLPVIAALLLISAAARADDDDDAPAAASSALPTLNADQQRAVGIVTARPVKATPPERIAAFAQVLDPSTLIADNGRLQGTRAAAHLASTEGSRLQKLYRGNAGASLKEVETAQSAQIQAQTQMQAADAEFALHWGPLAQQSQADRDHLIDALVAGRAVLLRADLPGRHSIGTVPQRATVDVDGVSVPARVLGPLAQTPAGLQSVGLLLQMDHPPAGLASGARLPAWLRGTPHSGVVVPAGSLLYGDQGAYVYRQLAAKDKTGATQFAPVPVKLLEQVGDGWLVSGVDADDEIVVHGAGVLWSLQGLGNIADDDDD